MVIHTFSRQNSFALEQECSWDPAAVLEIINGDTRGFTCVGYAPSQRRRCRNPIAQCNRERVFDMLDALALLPSSSRKLASMLPTIAALSLCRRYHQGQVDEVVEKWQARIASLKPRNVRTSSWRVEEDVGSYTTATTARWRTRQVSPERPKGKPRTTGPTPAQEQQRWREEDYESKRERERLKEELERMREELERLRNDKREKERKAKETKDNENQEREKKDEEKREQEKKDQESREREKKARQEQEAREQQERIKRAAERKREERERQERAKAAKEKEEWRKAWENYERCWGKFKNTSGSVQGDICDAIPWPVKSGRYADVKKKSTGAAMIEEFFRKGCLEMSEPAAAYSLIGEESKKWHPDKLAALFRGMPIGDEEKEVVTMIGQIVIKLRLEAKKLRDGLRGN